MSDKQALKAAYKQDRHRLRAMGIYQIKNQVNEKVFLAASPCRGPGGFRDFDLARLPPAHRAGRALRGTRRASSAGR